ncbi:hypothetical protein WJX72_002382 [[Myrmecia] bisecta]|uniref:Flotillin-like n=1 Tax=[Myrmecia] bisecta TaxID=41462 RepID=A0AAW1R5P7_9CHLO
MFMLLRVRSLNDSVKMLHRNSNRHGEDEGMQPITRVWSSGFFTYRVAGPNEYLVRSGLFVKSTKRGGLEAGKKFLQKPFQTKACMNLNPVNYHLNINAMSAEMVPFTLPVVFTIVTEPSGDGGPVYPSALRNTSHSACPVPPSTDMDAFLTCATQLTGRTPSQIKSVIEGLVQGEARVYSSTLTIREMFTDRKSFKNKVVCKVQEDMNKFGLYIYNANIAEMHDMDENNKYFTNLKQQALEGANTHGDAHPGDMRMLTAPIEIDEISQGNKHNQDITISASQGEVRVSTAQIETDVVTQENKRRQDTAKSRTELAVITAQCKQQEDLARLEAGQTLAARQAALQMNLNKAMALQERERLRMVALAKAEVDAEARIAQAQGEAEAQNRLADASLYAELKRAEGIKAVSEANAAGLAYIVNAAGGNPDLVKFHLANEKGLFETLAIQTASAVQGLFPKINIWNTGAGGGAADANAMAPIRNLFTSLPPMLEALQQQTNVQLPAWLPQNGPSPAVASTSK